MVDDICKWFCPLVLKHSAVEKKKLGAKVRMDNKAAWVIELGKGLPTISQLSHEQGLWIY